MVVSHSHPLSETDELHKMLRDLLGGLQVDFRLRNLPGSGKSRVTDVYCPEVRRSPLRDSLNVNHLDVVSCWKGLSFHQASEIAYWESTFKSCLEDTAFDAIAAAFAMFLERLKKRTGRPLTPRMILTALKKFLSANARYRPIDVSVPDLVTDMIAKFFKDGHNRVFRWFTSTRNLPAAIYNFIRTRDCFVDSFQYPKLELTLTCEIPETGGLHIVGDVHWQLPIIDFINLPVKLPAGAEYRITPAYREPVLSEIFTTFPIAPEFIVSSKILPHVWDSYKHCFRTMVPVEESQKKLRQVMAKSVGGCQELESLETTFSAKLVTAFPDGVRFEQTTRYSIKLEVEPKPPTIHLHPTRHTSWTLRVPPNNADLTPTEDTVSVHLSPPWKLSPGPEHQDTQPSPPRVSSWMPSYSNTPQSKRRRDSIVDDDSMSVDSPHTSSVDRSLRSAAVTAIFEQPRNVSGPPYAPRASTEYTWPRQADTLSYMWPPAPALRNDDKLSHNVDCSSDSSMSTNLDPLFDDKMGQGLRNLEPLRGRSRHRIDCFDSLRDSCINASCDATKSTVPRTPFGPRGVDPFDRSDPANVVNDKLTGISQPDATWSIEATPGSPIESTTVPPGRNSVPQKRKATKQVTATAAAMFKLGQVFAEQRLALEEMERQGIEVADKRQRISSFANVQDQDAEQAVSIIGMDERMEFEDDVARLANTKTETGPLGEACGTCLPSPTESSRWFERLKEMENGENTAFGGDGAAVSMSHAVLWNVSKSRAYETADGKGKVMPGLKKKGSVKRMVFVKQRPLIATQASHSATAFDQAADSTTTSITKGKYILVDPMLWDSPFLSPTQAPVPVLNPSIRTKEKRDTIDVEEAQRRIRENYDEFVKDKEERERRGSEGLQVDGNGHGMGDGVMDEDVRAMEQIFLAESASGSEVASAGSTEEGDALGMRMETGMGIKEGEEKETVWEDEGSAMDEGDGIAMIEMLEV
ncbi:hypothetical protein K491DRAFT_719977 [Lophiostoma macrostomum CBS 122681]|uniref:Uncharacterized protein n=1 Tax=Lophiostoma macrostomum CBS 122681 TaxID=1314788 RepID=A0A6A6SWA2_9PLEO|nr:hypothetical protein K491DRAFT_719977 [Lophiostoma macrostomum CBS 122681]